MSSKIFITVTVLVIVLACLLVPNHAFVGGGCKKTARTFRENATSEEKRALDVLKKNWYVRVDICGRPTGKRSIEKVKTIGGVNAKAVGRF